MIPAGRKRALLAAAVLIPVSFAVLVHASLVSGAAPRSLGAALSLIPISVLAVLLVRRSRHPRLLGALLALAVPALWLAWPQVQTHFSDILFLEHAIGNLVMAYVFGRTLAAGREPLVARFARMVHGEIPPEVALYARRVTMAWTMFFVLLLLASCFLYLGGLRTAWSFLANILSPLLVMAMFVVEYVVRHRVLPNWERVGILGGVQAFMRHAQAAPYQPSR